MKAIVAGTFALSMSSSSRWHPELRRSLLRPSAHALRQTSFEPLADDCVADKMQEFAGELANSAADLEEQVVAFEFPLRFVRDLHQPLHDSDDRDRSGNDEQAGFKAGNLCRDWDMEFVDQLGRDAKTIASDLIGHIARDQVSNGEPAMSRIGRRTFSGLQRAASTVNVPSPTPVAVIVVHATTPPRPLRMCRCNSARPTSGSR